MAKFRFTRRLEYTTALNRHQFWRRKQVVQNSEYVPKNKTFSLNVLRNALYVLRGDYWKAYFVMRHNIALHDEILITDFMMKYYKHVIHHAPYLYHASLDVPYTCISCWTITINFMINHNHAFHDEPLLLYKIFIVSPSGFEPHYPEFYSLTTRNWHQQDRKSFKVLTCFWP